ncbi:RNA-directed DNA polymerase, eukaryota, reverse transcriptase zinc-binding domain protein [Tanacetum coccineum]
MGGQSVYDDMREHNEEVKWGKLVWYSQCIPKHSFILWMVVQRRLLTHDRMKCWGCYDMMVYGLCMMGEESHDYLFFQCAYSKAIWLNLQGKMKCTIHAQSWKDIVDIIVEKPCLNEEYGSLQAFINGCLSIQMYSTLYLGVTLPSIASPLGLILNASSSMASATERERKTLHYPLAIFIKVADIKLKTVDNDDKQKLETS